VAEEEGEVVVDAALAVVQVGVAHPARLDLDDRLARTGVGDDDVDELDLGALGAGDDSLDGLRLIQRLAGVASMRARVPRKHVTLTRRPVSQRPRG
jgi:hypothetical protein